MRFYKSKKYFWKILSTIGVVSIVFQLITLSTLAYFMVVPLGQRAADDLANVVVHAAETWQTLSSSARPVFVEKMKSQHELQMTGTQIPLAVSIGREIPIKQSLDEDGNKWFWADIPVSDNVIRPGFARWRIGVNPPIVFLLLITIGLYLTIITAVKLTGRLTVPIERLHQAAQALGKGQWPDPVKIDGAEELSVLAREFNPMVSKSSFHRINPAVSYYTRWRYAESLQIYCLMRCDMVTTNQLKFCTTAIVIKLQSTYWIMDPVFLLSSLRLCFGHFTGLRNLVVAEPGASGLGACHRAAIGG